MTEQQRAVGIFNSATEAEAALRKLDESHFSLDKVYVIARNTEREGKIVDTQLCESLRDRFLMQSLQRVADPQRAASLR